MRVLMNMQAASGQRSGVGHYTWQLAEALCPRPDVWVRTYPTAWEARLTGWYERQSARFEAIPQQTWGKAARGRLIQASRIVGACSYSDRFGRVAERERIALYHEPFFIPLPCEVPTIATVHDLSVVLHPEWHKPETVAGFDRLFAAGLQRCRHLLTLSECMKGEIIRHLGWPAERVSVAYMGVRSGLCRVMGDELTRVLQTLNLPPSYLLHVGTLEPRKNLLMLLKSYCTLPAAVRERHPLVLAGGAGWKSDDVHAFLQSEGKQHNVRWLGYVKNEHFPALYSGARALVFPTFYEGFGMPTIEMMACGGAVLASTAGAVAETVGKQAYLIDPRDDTGWRDAMLRVCTDDDWWNALKDGAEDTAKPYTWERCAADTVEAYRKALGEQDMVKQAA